MRRNNSLSMLGSHLSTNTNKEVYKGQFRKYLESFSVMVSVKSCVKDYYGRTENRKMSLCSLYLLRIHVHSLKCTVLMKLRVKKM